MSHLYELKMNGTELKVLLEIKAEKFINLTLSPDDKYKYLLFAVQSDLNPYVHSEFVLKKLELETSQIETIKDGAGNQIIGVPLLWT